MITVYALLLVSLLGLFYFALVPYRRNAGQLNIWFNGICLLLSAVLAIEVYFYGSILSDQLFFIIDALNIYLMLLTAFVGFTTALFSAPYMLHELASGKLNEKRLRLYYSMYQGFMLSMYLVLTTNNVGIMWVAMEGATLATVLLVSLYRTPESIEAAWKYFILCGVGIAQALFGTILLYYAAIQTGDAENALFWSVLYEQAEQLNPEILEIALVFLLVGYGTKLGLVPLHNWLPDAHSEGPTPMSAILSGLLLNDALYAVVRNKMILDKASQSDIIGLLMMGFGLLSFIVAAIFLNRQKDIKRLFSYSSIEHMGLMTFAFGLGSSYATIAGLLHMVTHSLTKSAIFVTVGHAARISGTQSIEKIRGLINTQPKVGWGLLIGTVAIAGFPPFGIFASEFLVIVATMQSLPWLAPLLVIGVVLACAGLFRNIQPMVFGVKPENQEAIDIRFWPILLHLVLVLWLGLTIPNFLADWFTQATVLITGEAPS